MFQFLFCYLLERKDKKWFKRDIIVLISFLILFVSISFLVSIGKEMSLPVFRKYQLLLFSRNFCKLSCPIFDIGILSTKSKEVIQNKFKIQIVQAPMRLIESMMELRPRQGNLRLVFRLFSLMRGLRGIRLK